MTYETEFDLGDLGEFQGSVMYSITPFDDIYISSITVLIGNVEVDIFPEIPQSHLDDLEQEIQTNRRCKNE